MQHCCVMQTAIPSVAGYAALLCRCAERKRLGARQEAFQIVIFSTAQQAMQSKAMHSKAMQSKAKQRKEMQRNTNLIVRVALG